MWHLTTATQGWLIGPGAPPWLLGRQEHEGMGTQHLQIHTLPQGGLQHREDDEPSSAAIVLRNATGRGQHGQRGCHGLWVGALEGQNHLAGRAGCVLEGRQTVGENLGPRKIHSPLPALLAHGSFQLPAFAQGWPSPLRPSCPTHPGSLVGASNPYPSLFCPRSLVTQSALPLPVYVGVRSPWLNRPLPRGRG